MKKVSSFYKLLMVGNIIGMTTFVSMTVYSIMTQQYGLMLCSIYGVLLTLGSFWWCSE
jgi:hypothetical protein